MEAVVKDSLSVFFKFVSSGNTKGKYISEDSSMSAQAQMRAMLDQLMGTSRDGEYYNIKWVKKNI